MIRPDKACRADKQLVQIRVVRDIWIFFLFFTWLFEIWNLYRKPLYKPYPFHSSLSTSWDTLSVMAKIFWPARRSCASFLWYIFNAPSSNTFQVIPLIISWFRNNGGKNYCSEKKNWKAKTVCLSKVFHLLIREIVGPNAGILSDEAVDRTFWIGMLFIYLKLRIN